MSGEFVICAKLNPTRYYWIYHERSYRTYTQDLDYALRVSETRANEIVASERGMCDLEVISLEVARVLIEMELRPTV